VADGTVVRIPPTAQCAVDDAAAQVDTTSINITVPVRAGTYEEELRAERIRRYLLGAWHMIKQQDGLVLHHVSKSGFRNGMLSIKIMVDPSRTFPLMMSCVNPRTFFPDPAREFVIEAFDRKGLEIQAMFPDVVTNSETTKLWIEYWDAEKFIYMWGEDILHEGPHPFGFLPYVWRDAGLGYVDHENSPEALYRGILFPVKDVLEIQAKNLAQADAIISETAWPGVDFSGANKKLVEATKASYEIGPGQANAVPAGVEITRHGGGEPPRALWDMYSLTSGEIDSATVPRVARGESPRGAASGYKTAILSGMARLKFGGVVTNIQSMIEEVNIDLLKLVENVFGVQQVWGYTYDSEMVSEVITLDDIDGFYSNFVTVSAIPPEEKERTIMVGLRLLQAKAISLRYFLTQYLRPTNPREVEDQLYVDELMHDPQVRQMLLQRAFQSYEASAMLENVGADDAADMVLGTQGSPVPPMGGSYVESERQPGRAQMAGSIEELSQVTKAMGAGGFPAHALNAYRSALESIKKKEER